MADISLTVRDRMMVTIWNVNMKSWVPVLVL